MTDEYGFPRVAGRYQAGSITSDYHDMSGGPGDEGLGTKAVRALSPAANVVMSFTGGARKDVHNALSATDPDQILDHADKWNSVYHSIDNYTADVVSAAVSLTSWSGDDADKARNAVQGLLSTFNASQDAANKMYTSLQNMGNRLKWCKDNYGHNDGVGDSIANAATLGSGDDDAANAFHGTLQEMQTQMTAMPQSVPYETMAAGNGSTRYDPSPTKHGGGPVGGAPSVGGPSSAAHQGHVAPPHVAPPPHPGPGHPPPRPDPGPDDTTTDPPKITDPPYTNPPGYDPGNGPGSPGGSGYQGGGAGIGSPGLDTSGSLAGYDPSGVGGGAGSGALGGAPGAGSGAGGVGAGGLPGGGLPGGGAAGGGLGGGAGAGGGMAGVGGRGQMMPMHGNNGNDDDERERNTWLTEDEDVWGAEDSADGVIR